MGCRESISGNFEFFEWYPKFAIMVPKKTSRPIRMLCRPFPHRKLPFSSILGGVLNSHGGVLNPNANRPTLDLPPIYTTHLKSTLHLENMTVLQRALCFPDLGLPFIYPKQCRTTHKKLFRACQSQ